MAAVYDIYINGQRATQGTGYDPKGNKDTETTDTFDGPVNSSADYFKWVVDFKRVQKDDPNYEKTLEANQIKSNIPIVIIKRVAGKAVRKDTYTGCEITSWNESDAPNKNTTVDLSFKAVTRKREWAKG